MSPYDATVVGAGPNGLSAAVELARNGRKVLLVEAAEEIGGGTRTAELTLPGFRHDVCSAIHPSGAASPFFNQIGLDVEWLQPPVAVTHPLDGGRVAALHRSIEETAAQFGEDAETYRRIIGPLAEDIDGLIEDTLSPITPFPKHLGTFTRAGTIGALPLTILVSRFESEEARALLAGLAAHAIAPLSRPGTSAVAVMFAAIGHEFGWPLARGGSMSIAEALARQLAELGGEIETGRQVRHVDDLPGSTVMLNLMPPAVLEVGGERIDGIKQMRLRRWKPGPGIFKVDWALDGPIPWSDPLSGQSGTVHVGGTYEEVTAAEQAVAGGRHPEKPFVLVAQQSLFDDTRAPGGKHTAWGYCHVPNGSTVDMTEAIEDQIERFAPGFQELILNRSTRNSVEYEAYNPNIVGGDVGGGRFGLKKILQPGRIWPYRLGDGLFMCSSATPPGAGVHGLCGYHAARAAIARR